MTVLPILDLRLVHEMFTHGDLIVIMTWTLRDRRPALVIIPAQAPRGNETINPCIVSAEGAYRWSDQRLVGDPIHQERMSGIFAAYLGFNPWDHKIRHRIISVVQDHLQDLLTMPPMPSTGEVAASADLMLRNTETGEVKEIEAKSDV